MDHNYPKSIKRHRKCFICDKREEPLRIIINEKEKRYTTEDENAGPGGLGINKEVVTFMLQFIFNVEEEVCSRFLQDFGYPLWWIYWCSGCSILVGEAKNMMARIKELGNKLSDMKKRLVNDVTTTEKEFVETSSGQEIVDVPGYLFRTFIVNELTPVEHRKEHIFLGRDPAKNVGKNSDCKSMEQTSCEFQIGEEAIECDYYYSDEQKLDIENYEEQMLSSDVSNFRNEEIVSLDTVESDLLNQNDSINHILSPPANEIDPTLSTDVTINGNRNTEHMPVQDISASVFKTRKRKDNFAVQRHELVDTIDLKPPDSPPLPPQPTRDRRAPIQQFRPSVLENGLREIGKTRWMYACDGCGTKFRTYELLNQHVKTHPVKKLVWCETCGLRFRTTAELTEHGKWHTEPRIFSCDLCSIKFKLEVDFNDHLVVHRTKKSTKPKRKKTSKGQTTKTKKPNCRCDICDQMFMTKGYLKAHQVVHTDERPINCRYCDRAFKSFGSLKGHESVYHKSKSKDYQPCEICGKKLLPSSMRRHIWRHSQSNEKVYRCSTCGKSYNSRSNLLRHQRSVHYDPYRCDFCGNRFNADNSLKKHQQKCRVKKETFSCGTCRRSIRGLLALRKHERIHIRMPVMCEFCGKTFQNLTRLKIHQKLHIGETPQTCPICDNMYRGAYRLKIHLQTHSREKAYKCSMCDKRFFNSSNFVRHRRQVHGERKYNCSVCGKQFKGKQTLRTHEIIHTRKKSHECKTCGRRFNNYGTLKGHEKIHIGKMGKK